MKKRIISLVIAAVLAVMPAAVALADNVVNDVFAGGNDTFTAGGSTTVNYWIVATGSDGPNVDASNSATVTIVTPAGVTATPSSLTFTATGSSNSQSVVFTSSTPGDYPISASATGGKAGNNGWNTTPAKFTLHVLAASSTTTTTVVTSSANPSVFGRSVTFTATVTGSTVTVGTVTFKEGSTVLQAATAVDSNGQVTYTTSGLSVGSHTITAEYSGSGSFLSSSGSVVQTVDKASTTTVVTSSANPSLLGQSVTFTATVSVVAPGAGTPTGTVDFKDGATTIASGVALSGSTATFTTSALSVGSHTITAVYSGDGNFNGSTSSGLTQQVSYGFNGLLSPYSASKAFKLGSSIPLKWQYTDSAGNVVNSSAAAPGITIKKVSDSTTSDPIALGEDSGNSGLQYDATTNTWQFNWQTKGYTAGMYEITITSGQSGQTNGPFLIQLK